MLTNYFTLKQQVPIAHTTILLLVHAYFGFSLHIIWPKIARQFFRRNFERFVEIIIACSKVHRAEVNRNVTQQIYYLSKSDYRRKLCINFNLVSLFKEYFLSPISQKNTWFHTFFYSSTLHSHKKQALFQNEFFGKYYC